MQYRQVQVIGGKGTEPDKFAIALRGIAIDRHGQLYAAGDSEVKIYDASGRLRRRWPTSRPAWSVAVAGDGSCYVGQPQQIEILDPSGKPVRAWQKFLGPVTAIGFVADGVLAGDAAGRAIQHFDGDGRRRNTIGKDNPVNGFLIPNGVVDFSVDTRGIIHAANPGKHRVEQYTAGGELLGRIGRFDGIDPAGFTGCCNPTNIAVRDHIYVTEKGPPRVKAYDFSGNLLSVIATDVFDPNCKNMYIAAGPGGRVYVTDTVKNTILVFEAVTV
jgi:hypothetical protein